MNVSTSHSVSRLGESLAQDTGVAKGEGGERRKIVLGKNGFKRSSENRVDRSIKHFFGIGVSKNRKAWQAAARAMGVDPSKNTRLRTYMESGKSLTMRRLQKALDNPGNRKEYTEDFGMRAITKNIENRILQKFGEHNPMELESYQSTIKPDSVNNGTYVKNPCGGGSFAEFHRMEHGGEAPDVRNEKVHVTVHPDDLSKAYEAIAPILSAPDCPIARWKVVNMDEARVSIIELTDKVANLPDGPEKQKAQRDLDNAQRLHDGAHFTLYALPGQDGPEVAAVLRQIEDALRNAGVRTSERPDSDEHFGDMEYSSFRIGSRTYMPEDPGYQEALLKMGPSGEPGKPATMRVDPFDPEYAQFKATFSDNPFFQSLQ